ncbi:MAG: hypothetical protein KME17_20200 [Cyanosarcina radialis HA8281-LM2]|jgi:hypothetical protein|nr:hypothetical protein [Cyanosarcina radialis HA8281-LM2]
MQSQIAVNEHLSPELAQTFLEGLPEHIRAGLESRAKEIDYPVWAIIEMAIAGYLDEESISFVDCKPTIDPS